jgi:hypothetical protein
MPRIQTDAIGIPNHKLQKNLKLNGKYISNDGGDEGIFISDAGIVSIQSTGSSDKTILRLHDSQAVNQYTDIRYTDSNDEMALYKSGGALANWGIGTTASGVYKGNFAHNSEHACVFSPGISENWNGNSAGKSRFEFNAEGTNSTTQTYATGSGTSRFMELQETYDPTTGSVDYNFLSLKPTINQDQSSGDADGNYTGILLNVTETAVGGSANKLMDLQVGGSSKFKVDSAGNTTIGNIAAVGSDTDKFLMSDSGVVKYVTGANLLSYAGGLSATSGNYVKDDADDTMQGTLTIDKDVTNTNAGTYKGLMIDFDKTGSSSSNNTLRGIEVDLTNTTATGGVNTVTGIRNDITVQHAADSGTVYLYGITNYILGHDNAGGTAIGIINDVNNGSDQCIGYQSDVTNGQPDMKFLSSANSADAFTIATNANAETTFTTAQWQGNTSAHMNFVAGGNIVLDSNNDIEINANGGDITFKDDTTDLGSWDSSGNLLVKGDLIIDDGGSISEAGGTAAITFDGSGHITKIGQDSPSNGQVLTWDTSGTPDRAVWAAAGGGSARSVAGDTDNGMITWVTSDNTFAAESNLTFDGTDLLIASTGKLAVGDTATYIHQASDSNLAIVADGDITLDTGDDIILDADGDQIKMKFGGATGELIFSNENSGDSLIRHKVNAKDLVIRQYDGDEVIRFTDGGDVKVTNTVYFAAETANTCDSSGGSASATIDWNVSQKQKLTITGTSNTINFTNPAGPCNLQLKIVQGDGSDTITAGHYHANVKWAAGTRPTLSTGNGAIDIISLYFDGTSYHGVASLGFATA